jgi:hypothetical protein
LSPFLQGGSRKNVVVKEASSRYSSAFNLVEEADHISICRPTERISRSFSALTSLLRDICSDPKVEC